MSDPSDDTPFRSAEAWLADRGVERDPIRVAPRPDDERTPVSRREAQRLATEAPPQAPHPAGPDEPGGDAARLEDEVDKAVAYARRATAQAPKSEARLRERLQAREVPDVAIDLALERCREQGIVDDGAFAQAFVDERRRKGHAPFRIRVDLGKRGITDEVIDRVLARFEDQDPEAQALEVAVQKASRLTGEDAETAFRRTAAFVARRGYTEGIARKVAREAVFDSREDERTAGH